jgi:hypothetical protein
MNEFEWAEKDEQGLAWGGETPLLHDQELAELVRNVVAELQSSPELEESVRWLADLELDEEVPQEAEIWGSLASAAIAVLPALVKAAPGIIRAVKGMTGARKRRRSPSVRAGATRSVSSPPGLHRSTPSSPCAPVSGSAPVSGDLAAAAAALVPVLMAQLQGAKSRGESLNEEADGYWEDEAWQEGEYRWIP